VAQKTLKSFGMGGGVAGLFLVVGVVAAIWGFCTNAADFRWARVYGDVDSNASMDSRLALFGMVFFVVFGLIWAVVGTAVLVRSRKEVSFPEVIAGLQAWAARHGWEFTGDMSLAAHWATRFHFSADALTRPFFAARGWVHGRDAMILFCSVPFGDGTIPKTIIVVDADADYPVTAVAPRRGASAGVDAYGSAVPLESVEFERRWRAMGSDAAGSHAVFTPRVIERLLEPTPGGQSEIVWDGPGIRAADDGYIADPMHLESRLLLLADLAGLTPAYQVTHTNDDPSLRPYVPRPSLNIRVPTWVLIAVGLVFGIAFGAPLVLVPLVAVWVAFGLWAALASLMIGLALIMLVVHLLRHRKARRARAWHAAHASALGPPPTERLPAGP
jgi:hypothetical protein